MEPIQAMLRRKTNEAWTDKHRNVTRKLVKEVGCRKECPPLVGQTKRSLGDVTKKDGEAQTSLPLLEGSQEPDPGRLAEVGAKCLQRKTGSGREELRHTL